MIRPLALQTIPDPLLKAAGVSLQVFRLDQLHPDIDGNKWYKLKHNLAAARQAGYSTVLSFGGAWSNHIHALAKVGFDQGFQTIGVIRGEPAHGLTPTLQDASNWGMRLKFVSRADYREKDTQQFLAHLKAEFGQVCTLPEGGTNEFAVQGCADIIADLNDRQADYDLVVTPVGTGGTLAGLVKGVRHYPQQSGKSARMLGIAMLKGAEYLNGVVTELLGDAGEVEWPAWQIEHRFHCGGYAKRSPELMGFIGEFLKNTGIQTEPVYSGKMLWGLYQMIRAGEIEPGTRVIAIHTGGMQGARTS